MNFSQFNKKSVNIFDIDTKDYKFQKASNFLDKKVIVNGFFFMTNKLTNTEQVVVINNDNKALITLSTKVAIETFKAFEADPNCIQGIKDNECIIHFYPYHSKKFNKECTAFEFVNAEIPF